MVGSCDKMSISISSSTANEWPQILNGQKIFMDSSSRNNVMERSFQDPFKCPRCYSSNTKFCYYNNYSLSQPRYFCKACKRYWTKGGTLRNVPVGGGCRKNKKVKRHQSNYAGGSGNGISSSTAASMATIKPSNAQPNIDLSPASNRISNPLFYSMSANYLELDFPFFRFIKTRISSDSTAFNHQPQINDIDPMFLGSSDLSPAPTSTVASLLASIIHQQRFVNTGLKDFQTSTGFSVLMPYEDMGMLVENEEIRKESKIQGEINSLEWNSNQIEEQINTCDSSCSHLWKTNNVGAWFGSSNMDSSVH